VIRRAKSHIARTGSLTSSGSDGGLARGKVA
jgi:hypothetical protein